MGQTDSKVQKATGLGTITLTMPKYPAGNMKTKNAYCKSNC